MKLVISLFFIAYSFLGHTKEICSRVATINYQEVLIDLSNNQKAEGLRYYLEQDKVAKKYLDTYQKNSSSKWHNALLGSIGTLTLVFGITSPNKKTRRNLFISGASIFAVNYLVAKTMQYTNEKNLYHAIEEYNKRNLPKIYLGTGGTKEDSKVYIEQSWKY